MPTERLQKILAHAGVASRRAAEQLILDGHVRVNGRVVKELGLKADAYKDRVELHGKRVVAEHPVYYLLHKPREVVTTLSDPENRETIADLTRRIPERVFPVGRLDYHTSGALLMTNDGEMAQALLHPKKQVPKVYVAKVRGAVSNAHLQQLRLGVSLDDGHKTRPAEVFIVNEAGGNMWLQITITEGKNRQVHRMLEAVGHRVQRLFRLSFAGLTADGLRSGEFRVLTDGELSKLKRDYLNPSKKEKFETARSARRARAEIGAGVGEGPGGGATAAVRRGGRTRGGSARGGGGAEAGAAVAKWRPAKSVPRPQREREAREQQEVGGGGAGRVKRGAAGGVARKGFPGAREQQDVGGGAGRVRRGAAGGVARKGFPGAREQQDVGGGAGRVKRGASGGLPVKRVLGARTQATATAVTGGRGGRRFGAVEDEGRDREAVRGKTGAASVVRGRGGRKQRGDARTAERVERGGAGFPKGKRVGKVKRTK